MDTKNDLHDVISKIIQRDAAHQLRKFDNQQLAKLIEHLMAVNLLAGEWTKEALMNTLDESLMWHVLFAIQDVAMDIRDERG